MKIRVLNRNTGERIVYDLLELMDAASMRPVWPPSLKEPAHFLVSAENKAGGRMDEHWTACPHCGFRVVE